MGRPEFIHLSTNGQLGFQFLAATIGGLLWLASFTQCRFVSLIHVE